MGTTSPERAYKLVDLFCGCGGISRGFEWTKRFTVEMGVEHEKHPAFTFTHNARNGQGCSPHVYSGDISTLAASATSLWEELNRAGIHAPESVDVVVGGPPCQGFSRNGVRKYIVEDDKRTRFYDDPRNHLYKSFLYILDQLRPKLVLIENVREFLNYGEGKFSKDLMIRLDELGYDAGFKKICAADHGVPQIRRRVFFVAMRKDVSDRVGSDLPFPVPQFSEVKGQLSVFDLPRYRTVRDAISDLPSPVYSHKAAPLRYCSSTEVSQLSALLRSRADCVSNHVARTLNDKMLARIRAIGTGRMKHIEPELRTEKYYGSAYGRLAWDEPALTITTWVYHVGSGRFAHPEEDRAITMREAARLQTFDDDFVFPPLINPVSQMIGNAVPPLMANAFAIPFLSILDRFPG